MFSINDISIFNNHSKSNIINLISPGRVNLIGEHTDYNNGFVLPAAISLFITAKAVKRNDNKINVYSVDMNEKRSFLLSEKYKKEGTWVDYIKGVIIELNKIKLLKYGVDVAFKSNLPMGSGLSSSAAFELINAKLFSYINEINLSNKELALLCQKAENNFIGVNCGIMDQFAVALGEKGSALFLDTMTLDYEIINLNLDNYKIVISNTNKPRKLSESAYNKRRKECETVVSIIKESNKNINSLRDVTMDILKSYREKIDNVLYKRAQHVIEENNRVIESINSLKKRDLKKFGELMVKSHFSLRDLYEVSCKELDTLVEEFIKYNEVIGSRMTGAGFGGCTVSIVKKENLTELLEKISEVYNKKIGLKVEHYIVDAVDGVKVVK